LHEDITDNSNLQVMLVTGDQEEESEDNCRANAAILGQTQTMTNIRGGRREEVGRWWEEAGKRE
jgi:hypothetical protein